VNKLSSPAIIVIGEVVGDSKKEQVLWRIKIKSQYSTSVWKGMNCIQYF
jgi:siroheme synthase